MNSASKNQQIEFEVFPKDNKTNYSYLSGIQGGTDRESSQINVVFSHQSVIVIFICAIMLLVASFSLGVEKGRLMAKSAIPQEKTKTEERPETVSAQAQPEVKGLVIPAEKIALNKADTAQTTAKPEIVPAPAAPENAQNTIATGNYSIQVASVQSESAAKRLSETLAGKGIQGFIRTSGKYTIVMAGSFASREDAQSTLKKLKKTYTDCFIRKI